MRKPTKTLAKKKAYKAFQLYMRTLWNRGSLKCYTCDRPLSFKTTQVGHWVPGHHNATYINEDYVRPQDYYCNIQLGGNQGEFRDRLRKELGSKTVDKLLVESKLVKDISLDEYLELEKWYSTQLLKLTDS